MVSQLDVGLFAELSCPGSHSMGVVCSAQLSRVAQNGLGLGWDWLAYRELTWIKD